ncbi:MAG TPA: HNH endonuclease [Methylomirabilota bacterium]|nr:HNH endonuclease [Methylomirabilota bacterium]
MSYKSLYFPKLKRRVKYSNYTHYRHFRQEIREDCLGRCVYCDAHENEIGGQEAMTLDHFKPKSSFPHLAHEPFNLLWACQTCNRLKDNYWPAIGTPHTLAKNQRGFVDPFTEHLAKYFDILPNGQFVALKPPANFIISTLKLNRSSAKKIREQRNRRYERKREFEAFYTRAIKNLEQLLANPSLSEEDKAALLQSKQELEKQFNGLIRELEPDFSLPKFRPK